MKVTSRVAFRPVSREDAPALSRLYNDAYRPVSGGDAKDFYPYPQLLAPEEIEGMISGGAFRWVVAELDGSVIGACGAVLNVGGTDDKIAEVFGLVIKAEHRFCGYGTRLFAYLDDMLVQNDGSMFIIAETRTAHSGGWKVVRRQDFIALGFEPAAHLTPAGNESMLLAGKVSPKALDLRNRVAVNSIGVKRLSYAVLEQIQWVKPPVEDDGLLRSPRRRRENRPLEEKCEVYTLEGAYDEQVLASVRGGLSDCGSCVIHLNRMRGSVARSKRFDRTLLVASRKGEKIGYALADLDTRDQRVKIVEMNGRDSNVREILLKNILRMAGPRMGSVFSCVIEVRSDDPTLHELLEEIGFFPTAYYPAFILDGGSRIDCVQFTYLENVDLAQACGAAELGDWPEASGLKAEICKHSP